MSHRPSNVSIYLSCEPAKPTPSVKPLGGSIALLKGLKGDGEELAADPGDPPPPDSDGAKVDNPKPKTSKKLGSAASRLASMRGEGDS